MTNKWKDGDKCEFSSGTGTLIASNQDRNGVVVVLDQHGEYRRVAESQLKPLKTPAEIERERVLKLAENTHRDASRGVYGSELRYFAELLYYAGLLHDKKVKPLSYQDFIELINKGWSYELMYEDLIENKHILRGSIEND